MYGYDDISLIYQYVVMFTSVMTEMKHSFIYFVFPLILAGVAGAQHTLGNKAGSSWTSCMSITGLTHIDQHIPI